MQQRRNILSRWTNAAMSLIWPDKCHICGCNLNDSEKVLCLKCELNMPRTAIHLEDFSEIHRRLGHHAHIERAGAYFFYVPQGGYASLIHQAKYYGLPDIARQLARNYAHTLVGDNFFEGIDAIVPVPLHFTKLLKRGYNQANFIAKGIADVTGIEVRQALVCRRAHATQTRKSAFDRWLNASQAYEARPKELAKCSHVLIVDDVLTTGSTLAACCEAIKRQSPNTLVSVVTLALAGQI